MIYEYHRNHFTISTDTARLDLAVIHGFLYHSYWSPGVPREIVAKAIRHSFCFGLYEGAIQVGFARVVTDYASFAYLYFALYEKRSFVLESLPMANSAFHHNRSIADVFVLPNQRGDGLGVWLIESIINCPALQDLRSFMLATRDAHELYRKFGFEAADERRIMVKRYDVPWQQPELVRE